MMANIKRPSIGFTLIEMMVTIAIVALLAFMAYPGFNSAKFKARRSDAHASLTAVQSMIASYLAQNNKPIFEAADLNNAQFANYSLLSNTPVISNSGYYVIAIDTDNSGYSIIANALDAAKVPCSVSNELNTGQCPDTLCWGIQINHGAHESSDNTGTTSNATSTKCW